MTSNSKTKSQHGIDNDLSIPADVPKSRHLEFRKNYLIATHGIGRIMLFAGDQKIEHLNDDFAGPAASADSANPEHLFQIASQAKISCFASQLGLICRYAHNYPNIPYVIKLNSKSNLIKAQQKEPISLALNSMEQVAELKQNSGLKILGVGYTVYIGSEFESEMLAQAGRIVFDAHQLGMFAILWMYPRGKAVPNERDAHIVAGAAGVACALGADFAKVNYPKFSDPVGGNEQSSNGQSLLNQGLKLNQPSKRAEAFKEAIAAAGNTKVICSGGEKMEPLPFFQQLWDQIHVSGAAGNATGRNIHERSLDEAIKFANAVYAITIEDASVEQAMSIFQNPNP